MRRKILYLCKKKEKKGERGEWVISHKTKIFSEHSGLGGAQRDEETQTERRSKHWPPPGHGGTVSRRWRDTDAVRNKHVEEEH